MPLSQGHDRQSLSPEGLTRWYRLCTARVCQGDGHERAPWYVAHLPVSIAFAHAMWCASDVSDHSRRRYRGGAVRPVQVSHAVVVCCGGREELRIGQTPSLVRHVSRWKGSFVY
jgi:hypothetical protein